MSHPLYHIHTEDYDPGLNSPRFKAFDDDFVVLFLELCIQHRVCPSSEAVMMPLRVSLETSEEDNPEGAVRVQELCKAQQQRKRQ